MSTDLDYKRERAQLKRDERAAKRAEKAAVQSARAEIARQRRAEKATQRATRRAALAELARKLRPVAPLLVVTGAAVYAQVSYGYAHYSPADWPIVARFAIAVGAALGIESIALYVAWHAHDALLQRASATAARLRRASYVIAFGVAGVAYAYFSDHWAPTPAACVFALFSAAGPWLWGLHTRRVHHMQLMREGQADSVGATFSAERWRRFPIRTYRARGWSIDNSVSDPQVAWQGYKADAAARRAARAARRAEHRAALRSKRDAATEQKPVVLLKDEAGELFSEQDWTDLEKLSGPGGPPADRRKLVDTDRDAAILADLRALIAMAGPTAGPQRYSRKELTQMYGVGSTRARRLQVYMGWMPDADEADRAEAGAR